VGRSGLLYAHAQAWRQHGHKVLAVHYPVATSGGWRCSCGKDCGSSQAKHPFAALCPNGALSATDDATSLKVWFGSSRWREELNLGTTTDKLAVLDADQRNGGDESLAELEAANPLPPTWRQISGSGSEHVVFAAPPGKVIRSRKASDEPVLGPGIDILGVHPTGAGSYFLVEPSRHISGRPYAWNVDFHPKHTPLAVLPDWLAERLVEPAGNGNGARHSDDAWRKLLTGKIAADEYPDMTMCQVAGLALRFIGDVRAAWAFTRSVHQEVGAPLSEDQLWKVFSRIARRQQRDED
jgi:hypothetical protein